MNKHLTTVQSARRHAAMAAAAAAVAVTAMATLAARIAVAQDGTTPAAAERFVPTDPGSATGTLVLRPRATVAGNEVRLKQVCRWTDGDAAAFAPIGELVVDHLDPAAGTKAISVDAVRGLLRDAGVNLAGVNLSGSVTCLVSRSAAPEPAAVAGPAEAQSRALLARWVEANPPATAANTTATSGGGGGAAGAVTVAAGTDVAATECNAYHTLRDRIMADLSQRTNVPVERLQVAFNPRDVHTLNFAEPTFRFDLDGRRVHDLGRVTYDVAVTTGGGGAEQRLSITCDARAGQTQVVVARGVTSGAVLRDEDVSERRTLVDRLGDDGPPLTKEQVVGQQAARDLRVGVVLTPRLVDPVPLARRGQLVTVTLAQGGLRVTTVARAMEAGSFGQSIRVQNEATGDVYSATLTGPLTADMGGTTPADGRLADGR